MSTLAAGSSLISKCSATVLRLANCCELQDFTGAPNVVLSSFFLKPFYLIASRDTVKQIVIAYNDMSTVATVKKKIGQVRISAFQVAAPIAARSLVFLPFCSHIPLRRHNVTQKQKPCQRITHTRPPHWLQCSITRSNRGHWCRCGDEDDT